MDGWFLDGFQLFYVVVEAELSSLMDGMEVEFFFLLLILYSILRGRVAGNEVEDWRMEKDEGIVL